MSAIIDLQSFYKSLRSENAEKVGNTNLIWLSPDVIEEEEGFNLRDYDQEDTIQHIEHLAQAWSNAEQMPPLEVAIRKGRCFVRDGHCRLRAARLAISRGAAIRRVSVIELKGNDDAANIRLLTSNNSLNLTLLQRARGYQRLKNFGFTEVEIGESVGVSSVTVRDTLHLLSMPEELQRYILDGVIAANLVQKLYRDKGDQAILLIRNAHERLKKEYAELAAGNEQGADSDSPSTPKIRVQAKHIEPSARPLSRFFKSQIGPAVIGLREAMTKGVPNTKSGTIKVDVPAELFEELMKLADSVYRENKASKSAAAAKNDKQLELDT